jgi:hypothetical protein
LPNARDACHRESLQGNIHGPPVLACASTHQVAFGNHRSRFESRLARPAARRPCVCRHGPCADDRAPTLGVGRRRRIEGLAKRSQPASGRNRRHHRGPPPGRHGVAQREPSVDQRPSRHGRCVDAYPSRTLPVPPGRGRARSSPPGGRGVCPVRSPGGVRGAESAEEPHAVPPRAPRFTVEDRSGPGGQRANGHGDGTKISHALDNWKDRRVQSASWTG